MINKRYSCVTEYIKKGSERFYISELFLIYVELTMLQGFNAVLGQLNMWKAILQNLGYK